MAHNRRYTHALITVMVLSYTAGGGLWILLSDQWLDGFFNDASPIAMASMLKGWFFILVTALMFYLALRKIAQLCGQDGARAQQEELAFSRAGQHSRMPLLLLSVGILALTGFAISYTFQHHRSMQIATLRATAQLKAQQLGDWLDERKHDAHFIHTSQHYTNLLQRWRQGDENAATQLKSRLEWFTREKSFQGLLLLDPNNQLIWQIGSNGHSLAPELLRALQQARQENKIRTVGPYFGPRGNGHIDFIAPTPNGTVVLHADPNLWLYPLLQNWPIPSSSGDTVLAHRDGNEIHFLNTLRFSNKMLGELRLPLDTPGLLSGQALRGEAPMGEVIDGVDYRNVPSLGIASPVKGTDWVLLVKMDRSEMRRESIIDSIWIGFAGLLAAALALIGLRLLRQHEQLAHSIALGQAQEEKLEAMELLHAIAEGSEDAIFATDLQGRHILYNRAASELVGKPISVVLGQTNRALFPAEQAEAMDQIGREVLTTGQTKNYEETLDTAKGRRSFITIKSPLFDKQGRVYGMFGIARDITERKAAEDELQRRFNELERFTQASIGRELHMIELKKEVNKLSQELGREPPYSLAFLKEADQGTPE